MDTMKKTLVISFCLIFLNSCDCIQLISGTIINDTTGEPIKGVKVYTANKSWNQIETDSIGNFKLSSISGGFFSCPPMKIKIEKSGYQEIETEIKSGGHKEIKLKSI